MLNRPKKFRPRHSLGKIGQNWPIFRGIARAEQSRTKHHTKLKKTKLAKKQKAVIILPFKVYKKFDFSVDLGGFTFSYFVTSFYRFLSP